MIYAIYDSAGDLYLFFGYYSSEIEAKRQFIEFCKDFGSQDFYLCRCGSFRHTTGELVSEERPIRIQRGISGNLFPEIAKSISAIPEMKSSRAKCFFSKIATALRFCRKKTQAKTLLH